MALSVVFTSIGVFLVGCVVRASLSAVTFQISGLISSSPFPARDSWRNQN